MRTSVPVVQLVGHAVREVCHGIAGGGGGKNSSVSSPVCGRRRWVSQLQLSPHSNQRRCRPWQPTNPMPPLPSTQVQAMAQMSGRTPEQTRFLLSEEAAAASQAQTLGSNMREPKSPQQVSSACVRGGEAGCCGLEAEGVECVE